MWEDVEGQESFSVSDGFELIAQGLLVQEHNYSATTHTKFSELTSINPQKFHSHSVAHVCV